MPRFVPPKIISADYLAEARTPSAIPAHDVPEIGIAGRSNVGKSTLLNRLGGRKALARVSKTPGRTRGLIFYDLVVDLANNGDRSRLRLVDLPGYGFARVGKVERESWGPLVEGYLKQPGRSKLLFVLLDARRTIEDEERQLVTWLADLGLAWCCVVTKIDKLHAGERGLVVEKTRRALGPGAPPVIGVSGATGEGVDRLWAAVVRAIGR